MNHEQTQELQKIDLPKFFNLLDCFREVMLVSRSKKRTIPQSAFDTVFDVLKVCLLVNQNLVRCCDYGSEMDQFL